MSENSTGDHATAATLDRQGREWLELAIKGGDLGLWTWNVRGDEVILNSQIRAMLGTPTTIIRASYRAWEDRLHPDDRESAKRALEDLLDGGTSVYRTEFRMRTAAGEWRW